MNKYDDINLGLKIKTVVSEDTYIVSYEKLLTKSGVSFLVDEELQIFYPNDYPYSLPQVHLHRELPSGFDHIFTDGSLCLGTPADLYIKANDQSIDEFLEDVISSYMFKMYYFEIYGVVPYGERSHGVQGILEFYIEYFSVKSEGLNAITDVCEILKLMLKHKKIKGHTICVCGSGKRVRNCHPSINQIKQMKNNRLEFEYKELLEYRKIVFKYIISNEVKND